jgi:NADP-dependent 3-hydroxy acid dehydrogenase YdfG
MLSHCQNKRLWAVVNNAGIAPMGFVDWISMRSIQQAMDVNYFGLVRVVKVWTAVRLVFLPRCDDEGVVGLWF